MNFAAANSNRMFALVLINAVAAILLVNGHHTADHHEHDDTVKNAFVLHGVVPDVVDVSPEHELTVSLRRV